MQKNLEFNLNVWKWHDVYADAVLFLTCKTYLSSCAMSFLDSKKISWHVQNFVPNKWFPCTLLLDEETKNSSIFVKTVALRNILQKTINLQSQLKTRFQKLRLRERNRFVGLHATEFKITHGWKCYRVYAGAIFFKTCF